MSSSTRSMPRAARLWAGLLVSFAVLFGSAQAQAQSPLPQRVTPQASTTTRAAAVAESSKSAAKVGERTCVCDVTCNGQSRSTASAGPNGLVITTPMRQACADKCNQWITSNLTAWANEMGAAACKTFQCAGSSRLSTGDPIGVGPYTLDTSEFPACKTPGGCCPEFTKGITPGNLASLFVEGAHPSGQPYTMTFNSNGAFSNALESYLKEWAHWLSVDGCKGVAGFSIKYDLYNTGSPTKPTSPNPVGSLVASQTVAYVGMAVTPSSFVWNLPASPNWWFVKATVTPIGSSGRPVECAKTSGCMDRLYTGWIDDALTAFRAVPGAQPAGSLRYLD